MLTDAQAREEMLNFLRRAVEYFDREAESQSRRIDPAQLYAEGIVVLRREEQLSRMTPECVISKIAESCDVFAHMAGVGGVETAGSVISYLTAHPEKTPIFMEGGVSALMDTCDDPREFFSKGCLTFHRQKDGKVTTPQDLRIAVQVRDMLRNTPAGR